MVLHIAICDDRQEACEKLANVIRAWDRNVILSFFYSGKQLLDSAFKRFDILFLDIFMPGYNGLEVAQILRNRQVAIPIVFVTASPDFALKSYEVHAFDYILKPVLPERVVQTLKRLQKLHRSQDSIYYLKNAKGIYKIPFDDIEFIESESPNLYFHLRNGTAISCHGKLGDIEVQLSDARFYRCHQSFLVNFNCVKSLTKAFVMESGTQVLYKSGDKKKVFQAYENYFISLNREKRV